MSNHLPTNFRERDAGIMRALRAANGVSLGAEYATALALFACGALLLVAVLTILVRS